MGFLVLRGELLRLQLEQVVVVLGVGADIEAGVVGDFGDEVVYVIGAGMVIAIVMALVIGVAIAIAISIVIACFQRPIDID
jgi:hypothetical protein